MFIAPPSAPERATRFLRMIISLVILLVMAALLLTDEGPVGPAHDVKG